MLRPLSGTTASGSQASQPQQCAASYAERERFNAPATPMSPTHSFVTPRTPLVGPDSGLSKQLFASRPESSLSAVAVAGLSRFPSLETPGAVCKSPSALVLSRGRDRNEWVRDTCLSC
eukprot:TRINITY_DN2679_c0_g1_i2.p1 TRINITY_DN2679_c0_g1~~TRINITY_DN2679_c0_g1_i2.p1  ORF type:complete len:118 (+),score=6.53 TRINITY_DN2679_c0_g1_i2:134-487(+)